MPLVTSYTRSTLIGLMAGEIASVSDALPGVEDLLSGAANRITRLLGLADIADAAATDMLKIETLATWQAWLAAYSTATIKFPLESGTSSLERSKIFDQIERRLAMAEAAAMRYPEAAAEITGGAAATITTIGAAGSPYVPASSW